MEKIIHANTKEKNARVAVLISDKINFKTTAILRDKKKRTLHNDKGNNPTRGYNHSKHLCDYAPNIGGPKYVKQMLIYKGTD